MLHSIAECVTLACLLEASAPKPGNVHRGADFDDLTFGDLAISGVVIGPQLERAAVVGVGQAILDAVTATRCVVKTNSNLGMILLLGPLAAVPRERSLQSGVSEILSVLDARDTACIWQAINSAQPGGLGRTDEMDITGPSPPSILDAMRYAAPRDLIAAQYADNFRYVFSFVVPWLLEAKQELGTLTDAVVYTHVRMMAEFPDTLIARKLGREMAEKSAELARQVLAIGSPREEAYYLALSDFDFWLRCDGRKRNPGTTADLIAAGLFVLLRDGLIEPPYR